MAKEYLVDGSKFLVEDKENSFLITRGYGGRHISIEKTVVEELRPGGIMGAAHRFGLRSFMGKSLRLLANCIKQDIDGNWILR